MNPIQKAALYYKRVLSDQVNSEPELQNPDEFPKYIEALESLIERMQDKLGNYEGEKDNFFLRQEEQQNEAMEFIQDEIIKKFLEQDKFPKPTEWKVLLTDEKLDPSDQDAIIQAFAPILNLAWAKENNIFGVK